ncbi:MAG: hypothetical protein AVDCRST_MAG65-258, partial [uncultured Solirubrobacteraceae bacterium]
EQVAQQIPREHRAPRPDESNLRHRPILSRSRRHPQPPVAAIL